MEGKKKVEAGSTSQVHENVPLLQEGILLLYTQTLPLPLWVKMSCKDSVIRIQPMSSSKAWIIEISRKEFVKQIRIQIKLFC